MRTAVSLPENARHLTKAASRPTASVSHATTAVSRLAIPQHSLKPVPLLRIIDAVASRFCAHALTPRVCKIHMQSTDQPDRIMGRGLKYTASHGCGSRRQGIANPDPNPKREGQALTWTVVAALATHS